MKYDRTRPYIANVYNGDFWVHYAPRRPYYVRINSNMSQKNLYRVVFMSQGQVYEIYAREVGHGDMFGFIDVEQLVFGERSSVVVDPSEEKIKSEFENVKRTYLPMHSIIRIDEVDKQGASKISTLEGNVTQFPMPIYTPSDSQ